MKQTFTRWLPAIAKHSDRKHSDRRTALAFGGLVVIAGLAVGPVAGAAPFAGGPNQDAADAIDLATGRTQQGTNESTGTAAPEPTGDAPATAGRTGAGASGSTSVPAESAQAGVPDVAETPQREALVPHGTQGAQSYIALDDEQRANAEAIVDTARRSGVGERGAVIGVATSLQESKLYNLGHLGARNDHDSQGLFQQRPSTGWGSVEEITDPEYASTAFFNALKNVDGWQGMPLTVAAQTVQVSAYPFAYAQWEAQAADIVQQTWAD